MSKGIKIKIDVTKIVKDALYKGAKGTYLDAVLWPTPDSQYGDDFRIVQDLGKEARDAGEKGPILGNAKYIGGGGQASAAPVQAAQPAVAAALAGWAPQGTGEDDSLPF